MLQAKLSETVHTENEWAGKVRAVVNRVDAREESVNEKLDAQQMKLDAQDAKLEQIWGSLQRLLPKDHDGIRNRSVWTAAAASLVGLNKGLDRYASSDQ